VFIKSQPERSTGFIKGVPQGGILRGAFRLAERHLNVLRYGGGIRRIQNPPSCAVEYRIRQVSCERVREPSQHIFCLRLRSCERSQSSTPPEAYQRLPAAPPKQPVPRSRAYLCLKHACARWSNDFGSSRSKRCIVPPRPRLRHTPALKAPKNTTHLGRGSVPFGLRHG